MCERNTLTPSSSGEVPTGPCSIDITDWGWRWGGRQAWTLENIHLHIAPGEKVLILGPSGSGKSTLMAGLAGLLRNDEEGDTSGTLTLDGLPPCQQRGRVGLVMQDPQAQVVLEKTGDDVAFGMENLGVPRSQIWLRVDRSLSQVGLTVGRHFPTDTLSGGQKQRLALASVTAMQPGVILLDEPTAHLDPEGTKEVCHAVEGVLAATGATLVVIEHRVDIWAHLVDRVVVLLDGHVAHDGPLDQVLTQHGDELKAHGIWIPGDDVADEVTDLLDGQHQSPHEVHLRRQKPLPPHQKELPQASLPQFELSPTEHRTLNVGEVDASTPVAVKVRDLAVGYEQGSPVRQGMTLDILRGRSTCITGVNGSGKTTLAMTLAGLLPQLAGSVEVFPTRGVPDGCGHDPHEWSSTQLLGRISCVFQEPDYQFVTRTVRQELEVGPKASGMDEAQRTALVEEHLRALRLTHVAEADPMTLSGGEKRRLSVATALISAPEILILDEPTFGQDRSTWVELVKLLRRVQRSGTTIIAITHDDAFIRAMGDDIIDLGTVGVCAPTPQISEDNAPSENCPRRFFCVAQVNPVTLLLLLFILAVPLLFSVDPVTAGIACGLELLFVPFLKMPFRTFLIRMSPLLIAAPLAAISMLLYGKAGGEVLWAFGPALISERSVSLAAAMFLRVLAMGMPAVVLMSQVDSTRMADGLAQVWRLPAQPVLATLAAARMTSLMMNDWKALLWARRIRGVAEVGRLTGFVQQAFLLLVFALRRGSKLSLTMEARGFGAPGPRTWARESHVGLPDALTLLVGAMIPLLSLSISMMTGHFQLIGS